MNLSVRERLRAVRRRQLIPVPSGPPKFQEFTRLAVNLRGRPFSFADRHYLDQVYASQAQRLILRASRQVEKSTLLVNRILYDAVRMPGRQILFCSPRGDQASLFARSRLHPAIQESPLLRRKLWPRERPLPVKDIYFDNGSSVFIRSVFQTADAARGVTAESLIIDEFQDLAHGSLPVLRETLSHSARPTIVLAGTPKWSDNALEVEFQRSTAHEWHVPCGGCQQSTLLSERTLGEFSLVCPTCGQALDARLGKWIPRHPQFTQADGFAINHLMVVAWMEFGDILERQREYDRITFLNEVLGLPSTLGDYVISEEEAYRACEDRPFAQTLEDVPAPYRQRLVMGIDWGGGAVSGTAAAIGYVAEDRVYRIVRFDRWLPHEDPNVVLEQVFSLCQRFRINWIAGDHQGGGSVYNRMLYKKLAEDGRRPHFWGLFYAEETKSPVPDGVLTKWTIGRTTTLGALFTRIKLQLLRFPRVSESRSFLDEFTCEMAEHDDEKRTVRYIKPEDRRDDALHATNYGEMLAMRVSNRL